MIIDGIDITESPITYEDLATVSDILATRVIAGRVAFWRERLGLTHYDIAVSAGKTVPLPPHVQAVNRVDRAQNSALLVIRTERVTTDVLSVVDGGLDHVIIHELAHIFLDDLVGVVDAMLASADSLTGPAINAFMLLFGDALESTINSFARAIVSVNDPTALVGVVGLDPLSLTHDDIFGDDPEDPIDPPVTYPVE